MKLTTFLLLVACMQVGAAGYGQRISISGQNLSLKKVFTEIQRQSGYSFFYSDKDLEHASKVSIDARNAELLVILNQVFQGQPLTYTIIEKTVVIKEKRFPKDELRPSAEMPSAIEISGIVTNENGEPLRGASVVVKGTAQGTSTDNNGHFLLREVDANGTLIISFIGYKTKEVAVSGGRSFSIQLEPAPDALSETIVIGYGTTTRRKSTGSVSSITAEEISKQPVANPLNALQGRVAGALVTQSNGLPGSRVTIQVRGRNTIDNISSGNQPLYIVDGVPFMISDNSIPFENDLNGRGQFSASGGQSPFNLINPADIERIDILKDADATAIYGARGANGVVLITTKKGKAGKTNLNVNVYRGQGKVGHFIPMMNTQQYLQIRKEAFTNSGATPTAANAPDLLLWDQNAYTDWQRKYLGGTATTSDAQATLSGGDMRTRFLLNAGFHHETPVFPGDYKSQRLSTRFNVDHNSLDRKFNANLSFGYSYDNTNLLNQDLSALYTLPPNMPLYNPDGTLNWSSTTFTNPESYLFVKYFGKTHNLLANALLRYTVLPGLEVKTSFGLNRVSLDQNTQNAKESVNPLSGNNLWNNASFANLEQRSYILEPQATYTRKILRGSLSALLGSTFQNSLNTSFRISGSNYPTAELLGSIANAGTVGTPNYNYGRYRYSSVFGRLTFDWDSKYLLNAVVRRDGSSRFGPGKRFGTFWSVGAGWVFTNESFAKAPSFLSFGKLRGSYGTTGNDQISDLAYRAFFTSAGTYQGGAALAPNRVNNSELHWQTTKKLEFGLDLGFWERRLELTANYYRNRTADQLGFLNLSSQAGFTDYTANFDANIQNTGFELELNTENIRKKDFSWRTSFNLTIPRTKLVSANPGYFFYNESAIGQPLGTLFRFSYQGVDPATGRPLYKDVERDTLTFSPSFSTDRVPIGNTSPKAYGGLNNLFTYKQFNLSFFFQFTKQDGDIVGPNFLYWLNQVPGSFAMGNLPTLWLDRWNKPGQQGGLPLVSINSSIYDSWTGSDATWGDASFLRLRNVNLSYSLPQVLINKWGIDNLKIYLSGQNLWWTSKKKYVYDPETGTVMPPLRVITAGINVTL
ncbi:MAG TPA: TonB-dependent receptor [Flavisolibacter sp.]|nr:TonB-dependent receptor [Flavisolibacter sp.]